MGWWPLIHGRNAGNGKGPRCAYCAKKNRLLNIRNAAPNASKGLWPVCNTARAAVTSCRPISPAVCVRSERAKLKLCAPSQVLPFSGIQALVNPAYRFVAVDLASRHAVQVGNGSSRYVQAFKLLLCNRVGHILHVALDLLFTQCGHWFALSQFLRFVRPVGRDAICTLGKSSGFLRLNLLGITCSFIVQFCKETASMKLPRLSRVELITLLPGILQLAFGLFMFGSLGETFDKGRIFFGTMALISGFNCFQSSSILALKARIEALEKRTETSEAKL